MSYTYEQIAEMSFKILTFANAAKSDAIQSIYAAKKGNFSEAEKRIASAHKNIIESEKHHTELLQREAKGEELKIPLLFIHAEDQMLTCQTLVLLAEEFVELYKRISNKNN